MKKYLLFASAILAFASCATDSFNGTDEERDIANGEKAITFGFDVPTATRAEGAAAATKLNNQFIVWAEKNETQETTGSPASGSAAGDGNLVIKNYVVNYVDNSAYTSTSNTKDWEYVGFKFDDNEAATAIKTVSYSTNVTPNSGSAVDQTIKYWDYAASGYTFTAVSAKPADISGGKVKIAKITSATGTGETIFDKGYEVTVTDMADLSSLYFADRVYIEQSNDKDRTKMNKYGGNVTFTFRNGLSQVRVGMYETIPGYDVKVTKFYYADAAAPAFTAMTEENITNFVANVPNVSPDVANSKTSVAGKFTVKYYPKNTANDAAKITNHPTISFTPTSSDDSRNFLSLGTGVYNTTLATTSATPTFDQTGGAYTTVFPQETNATNLKLKVDYQLKNTLTGETINITGKTAEVPAQYLQWKPNFKYTYLFKINDNDLYPITFDAVVIEAEDGKVEYITTVTEPSITTFGVKSNKYVYGGSEYASGSDIYATIMDASSVVTPVLGTNVNLYRGITTSDANFPITEASLAEAIAETGGSAGEKITYTKDNSIGAVRAGTTGNGIPAEDGSEITGVPAVKMANLAADVYAVEYIKTPATYNTTGSTYTFADEAAFDAEGTLYTDTDGTTVATYANYTADPTATFYKRTTVKTVGVYAYKIIKVVAPAP